MVSKTPLASGTLGGPQGCANGWLHVRHPGSGLEILGLYIPAGTDGPPSREAKEVFWRHLLEAQACLRDRAALLTGDFNTGQWGVDMESRGVPGSESFRELGRLDHAALVVQLADDSRCADRWPPPGI